MRRVAPDSDGSPIAAVHLGTTTAWTARSSPERAPPLAAAPSSGHDAAVTLGCVSLAFAYGLVNCVQDSWNEQLVKRGWLDWKIPSAMYPKLAWIWLVILLLGALTGRRAPAGVRRGHCLDRR